MGTWDRDGDMGQYGDTTQQWGYGTAMGTWQKGVDVAQRWGHPQQ